MPIKIPNLGPSSSGPTPQGVSISDAIKPALALTNLAQGIGKAGDALYAHDMKIMEAENAADLTEFKTKAKSVYADRQASFADDHDHLKQKEKWEEDLGNLNEYLGSQEYSPSTLRKAKLYMTGFEGDSRIGVASSAQRKAVERRDQAFKNGIAQLEESYVPGQSAAFRALRDDMLADQNFTPEVIESIKKQTDNYMDERNTQAKIQEDSAGWLERNKEARTKDPMKFRAFEVMARRKILETTREGYEFAQDLIAMDKLTDPNEVDALLPDLRPSVRETIKNQVRAKGDAKTQLAMRLPEFQKQTAGEVARMIDDYDPTGTDFDGGFVKILQKIDQLLPGPLKEEHKSRVEGMRDNYEKGLEREIKTVSDWGFAMVKAHFTSTGTSAGTGQKPVNGETLSALLSSKFLEDEERLSNFGFSDEQKKEISTAAQKEREALRGGLRYSGKNSEDLVRSFWSESNSADEDFPEFDRAVFQAIRDGKGPTHLVKDPRAIKDSEDKATKRAKEVAISRGVLEGALADYLFLTPEATIPMVSEFLKKAEINVDAVFMDNGWTPPRPTSTRMKGADTSILPQMEDDY